MKNRILLCFLALVFSGCVPYTHEIKANVSDHEIENPTKIVKIIEAENKVTGKYPKEQKTRSLKIIYNAIEKDFFETHKNQVNDRYSFEFQNHNNEYYKISYDFMGQYFLAPHTDHRYFNLFGLIMQFPTLGMVRCYSTWDTNHYCENNLDEGRLVYYGGDTSKIPLSEIHLNKSEEKLGITKEQKLQEILNCNSQIFLPSAKQINTDKCYRGWYNEIIEN